MSPVYDMPDHENIEIEASAWIAQIDSGKMSKGDLSELKEWIGRSPSHKQAFQKLAKNTLEIQGATENLFLEKRAKKKKHHRLALPVMGAMAAAIILALVVFSGVGVNAPNQIEKNPIEYATAFGEQRSVTLDDGTVLNLNTKTKVNIYYNDHERRVDLLYGEAIFDVERDVLRPFEVHTDEGVVRAVGTIFSVRLTDRKVLVAVEEGVVELRKALPISSGDELTASSTDGLALETLRAGNTLEFSKDERIVKTAELTEIANRHLWQQGRLNFDNKPLSEVVSEITRYSDIKIVIADPALRDLKIGGTFPTGETEAFLNALELGFDLKIVKLPDNTVYVSQN